MSTDHIPPAWKRMLLHDLKKIMPIEGDAQQTLDTTCHAVNEAFAAVERVTMSAGNSRLCLFSTITAMELLGLLANEKFKTAEKVTEEIYGRYASARRTDR